MTKVFSKLMIVMLFILLPVSNILAQFGTENPAKNIQFNYDKVIPINNNDDEIIIKIQVTVPKDNHIYIEHIEPDSFTYLTDFIIDSSTGFEIINIVKPEGEKYESDMVLRNSGIYTLTVKQNNEFTIGEEITVPLQIKTQMCNDITNVCYPPYDTEIIIKFNITDLVQERTVNIKEKDEGWDSFLKDALDENLFSNPFIAILIAFLSGLLTFFLPCTYPIVPLTISYLGSRESKNLLESFINSFIYVLGMAVIYALLGMLSAIVGGAFGSIAYSPYVLIPLVLLFSYFMFSMLGYYEIQLPQFLQKFKSTSVKKTKSKWGIFVFGIAAGLVATPCALPVVGSLLTLIAQSSVSEAFSIWNILYGMFLMFIFALGLGLLFIVLGIFTGLVNKLPKSGKWMVRIQRIFGILMLIATGYFLNLLFSQIGFSQANAMIYSIGILSTLAGILLIQDKISKDNIVFNKIFVFISILLMTSGLILQSLYVFILNENLIFNSKLIIGIATIILGIVFYLIDFSKTMYPKMNNLFKSIAILLMSISVIYFSSILSEELNILQTDLNKSSDQNTEHIQREEEYKLKYMEYKDAINKSKEDGTIIFIDFWATWCINCREFEHELENNDELKKFFSNFYITRVNYDENTDFAKKFEVTSLPNFIFINSDEEVIYREFGFADVDKFLNKLKNNLNNFIK